MLEAYKFGPFNKEYLVIQVYKKKIEDTNVMSRQLAYSGFISRNECSEYEVLKTFLKFGVSKYSLMKDSSPMKDRVGFTDMHDRTSSSIDSVGEATVDIIKGLTIGFEPSVIEEEDFMGRM